MQFDSYAVGLLALLAILLVAGCSTQVTPAATATVLAPAATAVAPAPTPAVAPTKAIPTQPPLPTEEQGSARPANPTISVGVVPGATPQVPPLNVTPISTPGGGAGSGPDLPAEAKALLDEARADVAQRAGVAPSEVQMAQVEEVDWRDGSLGCPQPGMMYPQVITPGYRFVLEAGGKSYEYHSDRSTRVVLCEQSS